MRTSRLQRASRVYIWAVGTGLLITWPMRALSQGSPADTTRIDTLRIVPKRGPLPPELERFLENNRQPDRVVNVVRPDFMRANDLIAAGKYEEAIAILLPAWKKDLGNEALATALKQAYRGLKNYRGVLEVLRVQLLRHPKEATYLSELADTYWQLDDDDSAQIAIKRIIATDPKDSDRHHIAAETFVRAGRYPEGIETYRNARRLLGDSLLFAENLAQLLEARREYAAAVGEYFRWLAARPDSKTTVQHRITNLVKIPEAVSAITAALKEIVRDAPDSEYGHRLYGDLLFESGFPDSAFAEYRRADHLAPQPGEHQLFGIQRSLETQQYNIARDQGIQFQKLYPHHPKFSQVDFVLARAELGLGHPDMAVGMLKQLASQMPDGLERGEVTFEIGEVYRQYTSQMDSARAYFRQVVSMGDRTRKRTMALVRLGDLDVYFGDLERADSSYRDALAAHPSPEEAEETGFHQAELRFFKKDYDACTANLKQLVQRFPRGVYVNDALELTILITDGKDAMNWTLDRYSGGLYAARRGQLDSALILFGQLATDSAGKLAAPGQFQIAEIKARKVPTDGVKEYRSLISRFPQSSLVPRAWAAIGALYEGPLSDRRQARTAYQTIVTDFRDSPLVEDARLHLQRLDIP